MQVQAGEMGVRQGWWPSFDERGPHPFPFRFYIDDSELWFTTSVNLRKYSIHGGLTLPPEKQDLWEIMGDDGLGNFIWRKKIVANFFSQLLAEMEVFKSVGDARKAGWNKPITLGDHWFNKKTVHLIVEKE